MIKNRSVPFGYNMINGNFTLNEIEVESVKKIFADYIGGKSLKTIASEMKVPYNSGKQNWNKNMVCRILENRKYLGENGYPQIVSERDFERAARIKSERRTRCEDVLQSGLSKSNSAGIAVTEYNPTEEIQRITNEINRLLEVENPDKEAVEALIVKCAKMKYEAISEVIDSEK